MQNTKGNFLHSISIFISKPHIVNKKLWGSKNLSTWYCKNIANKSLPLQITKLPNISNMFENVISLFEVLNIESSDEEHNIEVTLQELLPKSYNQTHAFQLICKDNVNNSVTFYNISPEDQHLIPEFSYRIKLSNGEIDVTAECDKSSKSYQWLMGTVVPQIVKWALEGQEKQYINQSLALVDSDKYYEKYNQLKLKYGKDMVKIWPECTDAAKFVYEDVAIATYILLLWEQERKHNNTSQLQTFVDLGCGNGLLVYILTNEGHDGVGIDVRKRQIWDLFKKVKLEEKTIVPSDKHLFPNTDWIIGNHSDELTPWIPVIAARSSYKCKFFLLPCCPYNFDGTKYQRRNSSKSQYMEYLEYIKDLCEKSGYITDVDRLKIPSTKRICLIGRKRAHPENDYNDYCAKIQDLLDHANSTSMNKSSAVEQNTKQWLNDFKAREKVERVRNCTQLDKSVIDWIVNCITAHLLEGCLFTSDWCEGKIAEINEVVKIIPSEQLKKLKMECGGLQTLLKNNHHIFQVQSGKVQLRYPKTIDEVLSSSKSNNVKVQQRPCWFYNNHPQGCPLSDTICSFLHVKVK